MGALELGPRGVSVATGSLELRPCNVALAESRVTFAKRDAAFAKGDLEFANSDLAFAERRIPLATRHIELRPRLVNLPSRRVAIAHRHFELAPRRIALCVSFSPHDLQLRACRSELRVGRLDLRPCRLERSVRLTKHCVGLITRCTRLSKPRIRLFELGSKPVELGGIDLDGGYRVRRGLRHRRLGNRFCWSLGRRGGGLGHADRQPGATGLPRRQRQPRRQLLDQVRGGDRGLYIQVRHERDVAERQRVRRVRHRHEQASVRLERQRHRFVALRHVRGEEVRRLGVDVKLGHVDVT